jgi:CheY-like chemotaxis protein
MAKDFKWQSVLLVDQDPEVRATASEILGLEGYAVEAISPRADALRLVEEAHPSILVMDPSLPNHGSLAIALALRAHALEIPLLVTAASWIAQRAAEELLAEGCLEKPFAAVDLIAAISRLCG